MSRASRIKKRQEFYDSLGKGAKYPDFVHLPEDEPPKTEPDPRKPCFFRDNTNAEDEFKEIHSLLKQVDDPKSVNQDSFNRILAEILIHILERVHFLECRAKQDHEKLLELKAACSKFSKAYDRSLARF